MSRQALRLVSADRSADLERRLEPSAADLAREAARLAEIAASFALTGLRLDDLPEAVWRTDADYRLVDEAPAPANDRAVTFPDAPKRTAHIAPSFPARALQVLDWALVLVVAELAAVWSTGAGLGALPIAQAISFLAAASMLKVGLWLTESYRFALSRPRPGRTIGALALGAIGGVMVANFTAPDARAAAALAAIMPLAALVVAAIHGALAVWIAAAHRAGMFSENIVVVGATDASRRLVERLERTKEARVVAIVEDRKARAPAAIAGVPVCGALADLMAWDGLAHIDRIVIAAPQASETRLRSVVKRLSTLPHRVDLLIDVDVNHVAGRGVQRFAGSAVACVSGRPHNFRRALVKRLQDVVLGALALVALAPALFAIAAAIKFDSNGPVLFRQPRSGFNNRVFSLLKFRTMHADGETVTRLGTLLRRFSLDELPQLINVLRGDMSIVGPRPHAPGMKAGARSADAIIAEYAHRHRVKPGITGWAQVNGCRGRVTGPTALRERLRFDLAYVARASLWFDLQILARTPLAMRRGPLKQK
jgi:exopolysaccharide biosynthesis polyprenyl glycosylphosphotransferase